MEELPECPRIVTAIEYPDEVIAIFRPVLRHSGVVAKDEVADLWDVLVLPADEDDAVPRKGIPDQGVLFALGKNGQRHEPQPLSHRRHGFERTSTMAAHLHRLAVDDNLFLSRAGSENEVGPIQVSLDGVGARRSKDRGKGTGMQPAAHRQGFSITRPVLAHAEVLWVRRRLLGMADDDHLFSGHPIFPLHSQQTIVPQGSGGCNLTVGTRIGGSDLYSTGCDLDHLSMSHDILKAA